MTKSLRRKNNKG